MQSPTSLAIEGAPASHWPGAQNRGGPKRKKTGGILSLALICYHARRRSPFHRTPARGRCCVLQASRCLSRSGDRQIQIHRDGLPIRAKIARSWVSFHQPVAQTTGFLAIAVSGPISRRRQPRTCGRQRPLVPTTMIVRSCFIRYKGNREDQTRPGCRIERGCRVEAMGIVLVRIANAGEADHSLPRR